MKSDWSLEVVPLGLRLHEAARTLARLHYQHLMWLRPTLEVLKRVGELPNADTPRFARVEATELRRVDSETREQHDTSRLLPPHVRERLQPEIGDAARLIRVHTGVRADHLAKQHGADAVSFGPEVFFADGRYRPNDPRGMALLAHEGVHVAHATRPNAAWQRSSQSALSAEEALAGAVERTALAGGASSRPESHAPPFQRGSGPAEERSRVPAPANASAPAGQPMAAAADRKLEPSPANAPAIDIAGLRQSLMRDLMRQIRSDMERGG